MQFFATWLGVWLIMLSAIGCTNNAPHLKGEKKPWLLFLGIFICGVLLLEYSL